MTLHPTPVIGAFTRVVCHGVGFTVSPTNSGTDIVPNGTTYTWGTPIATGSVTGAGAGTSLTFISATALLNPTNAQQSVTYIVTPRAPITGCQGTAFPITVTVNPNARINQFTLTSCSGIQFQVSPVNGVNGNIVPVGTQYTWTTPSITSASVTGGLSQSTAVGFFSGTLINLTNSIHTATYTVTPIAPLCSNNNSFTVTVTIDRGLAINTMLTTVCSGVSFQLTPTNPDNGFILVGTTYTWNAPSGVGFTGGQAQSPTGVSNIFGTLENTTNMPVTAVYNVLGTTLNCGPQGTFSVVVTVNPTVTINPISVTTCSGTPFVVSPVNGVNGNIVPMSTTYSWELPMVSPGLTAGATGTNLTFVSGTLTNNTNAALTAVYFVTPATSNCGPTSMFSVTVTVNPRVSISSMTAVICTGSGFTVTPTNGTNGIVPDGTTYTWNPPIVTGGMIGGQSGTTAVNITNAALTNPTSSTQYATYTITPNPLLCGPATPFVLTVTVNPVAIISPMTAVACGLAMFTVTPTDGVNGTVPASTQYTWSAPTGTGFTGGAAETTPRNSITGTLRNTTANVVTAVYAVTAVGTCGSSFTLTVSLNPAPQPFSFTTPICTQATFNVTPGSGIIPAGTQYTWGLPTMSSSVTGGDSQSTRVNNITGTLTNNTAQARTAVYTVTPYTGSCTGAPFSLTVTVDPRPIINSFTTTVSCSGLFFSVTPTSGSVVPVGTTFSWPSPVGTNNAITNTQSQSAPGTTNIYGTLINTTNVQQTATYTVTPAFGTCIGNTFAFTVPINPTPSVNNFTRVICSGENVSFTPVHLTDGSIIPINTTYTWSNPSGGGNVSGDEGSGGATTSFSATLSLNANIISAQAVTYFVTPNANGCNGTTFTVVITVNPRAIINAMTALACGGVQFTVN
ncbi:MAG: beta strand repeat-containing protein, partial [Pseudomonadota bacterium]